MYRKIVLAWVIGSSLGLIYPFVVTANWPPFQFQLIPTYVDGKITYHLRINADEQAILSDMVIKVAPPPQSTFVEVNAPATTSTYFDGTEVTFHTNTVHKTLKDLSFVVAVTDTPTTVFTTYAWLEWKGNSPGSYLGENVGIDITKPALDWQAPNPHLQFDMSATVTANDEVIYQLWPQNVGQLRLWDLQLDLILSPNATFTEAKAPSIFTVQKDSSHLHLTALELYPEPLSEPLSFKVAATQVITSRIYANWKNGGQGVADSHEGLSLPTLALSPDRAQQFMTDVSGDVPWANYDLTVGALESQTDSLKVNFGLVGPLETLATPLEFTFFLDTDCRSSTGQITRFIGAEYRARYQHQTGQAEFQAWDNSTQSWGQPIAKLTQNVTSRQVSLRLPYDIFTHDLTFCWVMQADNHSKAYQENLPSDWLGDGQPTLAIYQLPSVVTQTITPMKK